MLMLGTVAGLSRTFLPLVPCASSHPFSDKPMNKLPRGSFASRSYRKLEAATDSRCRRALVSSPSNFHQLDVARGRPIFHTAIVAAHCFLKRFHVNIAVFALIPVACLCAFIITLRDLAFP
ncbi:hypothetical protein B0T19DRAFT_213932 [Cercophora scortea]|uniref:Uncharacterized protein n=1 Tax=Cercophora scortea TaxID=314031 RepID=A0AAE0IGD6_9PEZI|nr:hypothetical protein B0T19DRAFT_213932 [Cercophora scortea]